MDVEVEAAEAGGVEAPLDRHLHPLASRPFLVAATSSEEEEGEETKTRRHTTPEPSATPRPQEEARTLWASTMPISTVVEAN